LKLIERILLVILGLLVITLIAVFFIAPDAVSDLMDGLQNVNILVRLGVVLVLDILVLAFVYSRVRTPSTTVEGLIVKAPGAITDIGIDSARSRILSAVQQVPNVIAADAKLEAVRGKAKIELNVTVRDSSVNVPRKHQEINQALKQVINKQLGLSILGQPRVHIHLDDERVAIPGVSAAPIVPAKPIEEPVALPAKASNGLPLISNMPVDTQKEEEWLESYASGKTAQADEEKKNGDTVVKP
jgi:hypothetical protein